MFIDDYIENISLKEELKNIKEQLKTVQDKNAKLKTDIDLHCKANAEKTEKIKRLSEELDILKYTNLVLRTNAAECKLCLEEKQQEADNLRNRVKDLEAEIDQLKSNPTAVSYSELLAIHTADVETINNLNIRARDLNGTISTLLERVSTYDKENQELKKKVQELNDFIQRI